MIDWNAYAIGEHRIPCPECKRGEREKTMGIKVDQDGGVAHCFRCGLVMTSRNAKPSATAIKPARTSNKHERLSDYGQQLWQACKPIDGTAAAYLQARKCVIPPSDGDLRWHPALKHPSGFVGAALVALVTHALTNEPLSLHRTWITSSGKANVDPPRMMLGNHSTKSGVIRLYPDDSVSAGLGIAEGIETALSLAHGFNPVWATIDAGHLKAFPVLDGIEALTVCVDDDEAGRSAANSCAERWYAAGRAVLLVTHSGGDINDLVREAA